MKYWRVEIREKTSKGYPFNRIIGVVADNVEAAIKKTDSTYPEREIISINCHGAVDIP